MLLIISIQWCSNTILQIASSFDWLAAQKHHAKQVPLIFDSQIDFFSILLYASASALESFSAACPKWRSTLVETKQMLRIEESN